MNSFTVTAVGNLAKDPELAVQGRHHIYAHLPGRQRLCG